MPQMHKIKCSFLQIKTSTHVIQTLNSQCQVKQPNTNNDNITTLNSRKTAKQVISSAER